LFKWDELIGQKTSDGNKDLIVETFIYDRYSELIHLNKSQHQLSEKQSFFEIYYNAPKTDAYTVLISFFDDNKSLLKYEQFPMIILYNSTQEKYNINITLSSSALESYAGESIIFECIEDLSSDYNYYWDFDRKDGWQIESEGEKIDHIFYFPGKYKVTLMVSDGFHIGIATVDINISKVPENDMPIPKINVNQTKIPTNYSILIRC